MNLSKTSIFIGSKWLPNLSSTGIIFFSSPEVSNTNVSNILRPCEPSRVISTPTITSWSVSSLRVARMKCSNWLRQMRHSEAKSTSCERKRQSIPHRWSHDEILSWILLTMMRTCTVLLLDYSRGNNDVGDIQGYRQGPITCATTLFTKVTTFEQVANQRPVELITPLTVSNFHCLQRGNHKTLSPSTS